MIASWLEAEWYEFGPEYRPVPLEYHVLGYDVGGRSAFKVATICWNAEPM